MAHRAASFAFTIEYFQLWPLLVILAAWKFLEYLLNTYKRWRFMPPGPKGVPLAGNLFQMQSKQPWSLLTRWGEQFGTS